MPDEPLVVRGIDWKAAFPFTMIFRSFRVAIHPSKLVLALLAVLLIYMGGRMLDAIWPEGSRAVPNEIALFVSTRGETDPAQQFEAKREEYRQLVLDNFNSRLKLIGKENGGLGDIKASIIADRDAKVRDANKQLDTFKTASAADQEKARKACDLAIAAAYESATDDWDSLQAVRGTGLFATFTYYQISMMHRVVQEGRLGHFLGKQGVLDEFVNLLTVAPGWGITHHTVYFTIFGIYVLIIWAIFGGAIARIAAVQVARDEKISFRQALSFSIAKFLSFVSAPIIPLLIIVVVGLVVTAGAFLLFNIPFLGPILGGALFFLALAAGFVMTLVLLGLLGGFNLMYPTVAVEGSDSFDAISRSFSYLFARPWRLVFHSLVAAVYGTFCFVFVRYFILLMLGITRYFASLGVFRHADNLAPLWSMMWPNPMSTGRLSYSIDFITLTNGQGIGAFLLAFWNYMVIAVLAAFAVSFYFSANTIIYILMRHEVDATELDDVYLEQSEEDFAESVSVTASPAPEAATASQPAATAEMPAPPAEGKAESGPANP